MLNITIDKVRHIEDKDANVRETLVELQHALDKSEQERHFYDALCGILMRPDGRYHDCHQEKIILPLCCRRTPVWQHTMLFSMDTAFL